MFLLSTVPSFHLLGNLECFLSLLTFWVFESCLRICICIVFFLISNYHIKIGLFYYIIKKKYLRNFVTLMAINFCSSTIYCMLWYLPEKSKKHLDLNWVSDERCLIDYDLWHTKFSLFYEIQWTESCVVLSLCDKDIYQSDGSHLYGKRHRKELIKY